MIDEQLRQTLTQQNQEHILRFFAQLPEAGRQRLAADLRQIDLSLVAREFQRKDDASEDWAHLARRAEPPKAIRRRHTGVDRRTAARRGQEALAAGEVGVVLVAGGQGTRLGFNVPKGMFSLGPLSSDTLFKILFRKVLAIGRRYGRTVPVYMMTSHATHEESLRHLEEEDRYGLAEDDLRPFCQSSMPAVDMHTGQLLLAEDGGLSLSPDGHGGMLDAMTREGVLEDARRRGLKHLFYMQVDNPLAPVCNPEFLGHHAVSGSELSTLVVAKRSSRDAMGNVVRVDGQTRIIEYSDLNPLPDEIVERRRDGEPVFWAGNTAMHVFDLAFLERMAEEVDALPWHIVRKEVPFLDEQGSLTTPAEPNAVKLERFIFDLLPKAREAIVMEVDAAEAFAPVKNKEGVDSPETSRAAMVALHARWLRETGVEVAEGTPVEIDPLFALDAEQVKEKIEPTLRVDEAKLFSDETA